MSSPAILSTQRNSMKLTISSDELKMDTDLRSVVNDIRSINATAAIYPNGMREPLIIAEVDSRAKMIEVIRIIESYFI